MDRCFIHRGFDIYSVFFSLSSSSFPFVFFFFFFRICVETLVQNVKKLYFKVCIYVERKLFKLPKAID